MMTKQKLWFASLVATCLLATTACVESKHPLSDPQDSQQVLELCGAWKTSNTSGDVTYAHIGAGVELPLDPANTEPERGLMEFFLISHSQMTSPPQRGGIRLTKPFGMRFFVTKIGGETYATCVPDPKAGEPRTKPEGYFFLKFRLDGDTLQVWDMNSDATATAIEARELGGTVEREAGRVKGVKMTDSGEKIAKFLAEGGSAKVFLDGGMTTYERVR